MFQQIEAAIPTERGERAFTRGSMTERSEEMGSVRVSSDGGICTAALPEAVGRALALGFVRTSRAFEFPREH